LVALGCSDPVALEDASVDAFAEDAGRDASFDANLPDAGPVFGDVRRVAVLDTTTEGIAVGPHDGAPAVYAGLTNGEVVAVDAEGVVTPVVTIPGVLGIAFRTDGTFVACGRADESADAPGVIYAVEDGVPTVIVERTPDDGPFGVTNYVGVAPDDSLVFTDSQADVVYRADADGSNLAVVTDSITYPNGLAFSADGTRLYVAGWEGSTIHVADFDRETGMYSAFEVFLEDVAAPDGIVVADDETLYFVTSSSGVVRSTGTGVIEPVIPARAVLIPANGVFGQGALGTEWIYLSALGSSTLHRVYVGQSGPTLPIR
jgi:sugar lactone lactonase YvrE